MRDLTKDGMPRERGSSESTREEWAEWLRGYGAEKFFDAFLANTEGAIGRCVYCGKEISVDISIGGGVPDWSIDGDFGCESSPDTDDDGVGGHMPRRVDAFRVLG